MSFSLKKITRKMPSRNNLFETVKITWNMHMNTIHRIRVIFAPGFEFASRFVQLKLGYANHIARYLLDTISDTFTHLHSLSHDRQARTDRSCYFTLSRNLADALDIFLERRPTECLVHTPRSGFARRLPSLLPFVCIVRGSFVLCAVAWVV